MHAHFCKIIYVSWIYSLHAIKNCSQFIKHVYEFASPTRNYFSNGILVNARTEGKLVQLRPARYDRSIDVFLPLRFVCLLFTLYPE